MGNTETRTCVYLVGAGPGAEDLITVRGLELLRQADVVVYDYLANSSLLSQAPARAKRIDVGKKGFSAHMGQDAINELLVAEARALAQAGGGSLVRLKGGDPFVFGRGGEEALALAAAGIPFEVVPGVTSGIAAAAYAGIPVTHRGIASSVTFVTGHEDPTKNASAIDWTALGALAAKGSTLCFYMGMRNLALISERLCQAGAAADTPAALISWGTTPAQRTLVSSLDELAAEAELQHFQAPAIILVGPVATLRSQISWFEQRPLFGRRIAVTRSREQASSFAAGLKRLGANVLEVPTIAFEAPQDPAPLVAAIEQLSSYDWIVFTSANGVDSFFESLPGDARSLAGSTIAAIGPATAARLRARGIEADVVPSEYRGEAVAEAICGYAQESGTTIAGARVLIPRAEVAREELPLMLQDAGAIVDVVAAYRTVAPEAHTAEVLARELAEGQVDAVTFTSSSTVRNLVALLGDQRDLLRTARLFSIGPITSATLAKAGFAEVEEAHEYTIPGLTEALVDCFTREEGECR